MLLHCVSSVRCGSFCLFQPAEMMPVNIHHCAALSLFFCCCALSCFLFFYSLHFPPHSDVNSMYLSSTEPPAAAEWACLLRPLRGREPEGIWNLLSIVREMFKRRDSNAAPLLEILTDQCLTYEQVFKPCGGAEQ